MSDKLHSQPGSRTFRGKNAKGEDHEVTMSWGKHYPAVEHRLYVPEGLVYDAISDQEARERGIANDDHEAGLIDPPRPTEREVRELKVQQARDDLSLFQAETFLKQLRNTVKDGRVTVVRADETEFQRDCTPEEVKTFYLQELELEHRIDLVQEMMQDRARRIQEMEARLG